VLIVRVVDWVKPRMPLLFPDSIESAKSSSPTDLAVVLILNPAEHIQVASLGIYTFNNPIRLWTQ